MSPSSTHTTLHHPMDLLLDLQLNVYEFSLAITVNLFLSEDTNKLDPIDFYGTALLRSPGTLKKRLF